MHLQVFRPQLSNHKMITYSSTNCRALAWRLLFSPVFFFFLWVMAEKSFLLPSVPNKKPEVRSLPSVPMSSYPNCSDWFNCLPPLSCCCISQCNSFLCQKRSQRCEGQVVCHREGWRLGLFKVYEWLTISFWPLLFSLSFLECEKWNTDSYTSREILFERLEYSWPYILSLILRISD